MIRSTPCLILPLLVLLSLPACSTEQAQTPQLTADVVVYGDASVGVAAAVQAARMGKSVILVSQYGHLGGLTSSGLGNEKLKEQLLKDGQILKGDWEL